jgi:outer membrane protein OmpA-like peptidoglycan-associated protein
MKKTGVLLILLSMCAVTSAPAQQRTVGTQPQATGVMEIPSESDMYCAGFIAPQPVANNSFIGAGWDTPNQSVFSDRDRVYLTGGNYQVGAKYQIVRAIRDDDEFEYVTGQNRAVKKLGIPYAELGRVRVIDVQKNVGIAVVELSCDGFRTGDLALPWAEKQVPKFRGPAPFNAFAPPNGKLTGNIVLARDFNNIVAAKDKVYLNVGSNQGVKVGDYFRVTRTYAATLADQADSILTKAPLYDPTQKNPPTMTKVQLNTELPRRSLGEMIILSTTPVSSTAMIMSSYEAMLIGDGVEMMEEPPPPPPPPATLTVLNPPSIACAAEPASVHTGESATVRCTGTSPDNRPLTYTFVSDAGTVHPRENAATVDTRGAAAGVISVMTTATDDRNLSASATTRIGIEAPPPPAQASREGEFLFKPNSAYVDNTAKAALDGVALRLQREANSSVMFVGYSALAEAARLGIARANNAKTYLTKDKGIDGSRIQVRDGGKGGRRVEIWFVPAGAATPEVKPIAAPEAPAKPAAKKPAPKK